MTLTRFGALAFVLVGMGGPATAQSCLFDRECFEAKTCAEAAFEVEVTEEALVTQFGTLAILERSDGGILAEGQGMLSILSPVTATGPARMSVHMDGPILITYHGRCEAGE